MAKNEDQKPITRMSLLNHLQELRKVIIVSLIAVAITSTAAFSFVDVLLNFITKPIRQMGYKLIVIGVTEGIFIKFKIALFAGVIIASPVILWEIWRYVVPALYPHEKKIVRRVVPISIILFIGGVFFSYYTVFPVTVYFLIKLASEFTPMLTVDKYLSFTMAMLIPIGLVFEYPLVVYILAKVGIMSPSKLVKFRKYAIVINVIIAAAVTPSPDPISTIVMAIPLLLLYEAGIVIAKVVSRKKEEARAEESEDK